MDTLQNKFNFEGGKTALSSPTSNFVFSDVKKIDNLYQKLSSCGKESVNIFDSSPEVYSWFSVPIYCNNRCCTNSDCKNHRGILFKNAHIHQISALMEHLEKPYAYIFTGYKLPLVNLSRRFIQSELRRLYDILKKSSISSFSVHMELKLYPEDHKDYGYCYLHFHVVSEYIKNIGLVRKKWKRVIRSERALTKNHIIPYIMKYSSKTPIFSNDLDKEFYHLLVYKTQMHRFCIFDEISHISVNNNSRYYSEEALLKEVYNAYKNDKYYHSFVDDYKKRDKPPPNNLDNFGLNGLDSVIVIDYSKDDSNDPNFDSLDIKNYSEIEYNNDCVFVKPLNFVNKKIKKRIE